MAGEDPVERVAHRRHRPAVERRLAVDRGEAGREQQRVAARATARRGARPGAGRARGSAGSGRSRRSSGGGARPRPRAARSSWLSRRRCAPSRSRSPTPRGGDATLMLATVPLDGAGGRYLTGNRRSPRPAARSRRRRRPGQRRWRRYASPRREAVADLEADRQPEVLQLADIELERLRLAPEGLARDRPPLTRTAAIDFEHPERPRAVAAGAIESCQPLVKVGKLVVAEQSVRPARLVDPARAVRGSGSSRGEILGPRIGHRFRPRGVAGRPDVPHADAAGSTRRPRRRTDDRRRCGPASGHDLRALPPAEHHRDLAALDLVAVLDRDQHVAAPSRHGRSVVHRVGHAATVERSTVSAVSLPHR